MYKEEEMMTKLEEFLESKGLDEFEIAMLLAEYLEHEVWDYLDALTISPIDERVTQKIRRLSYRVDGIIDEEGHLTEVVTEEGTQCSHYDNLITTMTTHGIDEGDACVMFEKAREESNYLENRIEDIFKEYSRAKKKLLS